MIIYSYSKSNYKLLPSIGAKQIGGVAKRQGVNAVKYDETLQLFDKRRQDFIKDIRFCFGKYLVLSQALTNSVRRLPQTPTDFIYIVVIRHRLYTVLEKEIIATMTITEY